MGLQAISKIPQLFAPFKEGKMFLLVSKLADDFFLTSTDEALCKFIISFNDKFKLDEVVHWPDTLRFYGMKNTQDEDYSASITPIISSANWELILYIVKGDANAMKIWMTLN